MSDFDGAKLALFHRGKIATLLRDDIPQIPWPNHWDLPGGGREGSESPIDCALRELQEELNIRLPGGAIHWQRAFPNSTPGRADSFFLAADLPDQLIEAIRLGDEGQAWQWMTPVEYLSHPQAIPSLQARLAIYLQESWSKPASARAP